MNSDVEVKCLLLPLSGDTLIVPNSLIAEIVINADIQSSDSGEDWQVGTLLWRGEEIQAISFDSLIGKESVEKQAESRYVVLHAIQSANTGKYYAMRISGIPRLEFITEEKLDEAADQAGLNEAVASRVYLNGVDAYIPAIEKVEDRVFQ